MDTELNNHIQNYIDDNDKDRRIAAIKSIGQNSDIRFLETIIKKVEDSEWEVRAAACKSLGRMGDNKALNTLVKALSDSNWWVRYNAANSMLELPEGVNYIHNIMKSEDKFAKDIIISAMEESGTLQELFLYENSGNEEKQMLIDLIKKYILEKAKQV
jgi:hypothetical protein